TVARSSSVSNGEFRPLLRLRQQYFIPPFRHIAAVYTPVTAATLVAATTAYAALVQTPRHSACLLLGSPSPIELAMQPFPQCRRLEPHGCTDPKMRDLSDLNLLVYQSLRHVQHFGHFLHGQGRAALCEHVFKGHASIIPPGTSA